MHSSWTVLLLLIVVCANVNRCFAQNTEVYDTDTPTGPTSLIAKKLTSIWDWVRQQANSENTFIGRCFGIGKKLRILMPLMIFVVGIIVTTLKFLTIFALKGLGIGVLLLILNFAGLFAKFGFFKGEKESHHAPPQNVHFHIHNKDIETSGPSYDGHGWSDRISSGLSKTTSVAEQIELLNLYKRLGLNVDNLYGNYDG